MRATADAITQCKFEATDPSADEVVLYNILQVSAREVMGSCSSESGIMPWQVVHLVSATSCTEALAKLSALHQSHGTLGLNSERCLEREGVCSIEGHYRV